MLSLHPDIHPGSIHKTSRVRSTSAAMRHIRHWSPAFCLTWFWVLALSTPRAQSQASPYSPSPLFPKYLIMGVVYAPPGSSSSVTYGHSSLVGSSMSYATTNSYTDVSTTSVSAGATLGLFGASTTYSTTNQWTISSENIHSVAVQTTQGNSISSLGPISASLGVNHDNDVIYIWLNPVVVTTAAMTAGTLNINWNGLASNSCDPLDAKDPLTFYQYVAGCDANQFPFPDIVGIPVWCLKNPYFPGQGCAQWLPYTSRSWDQSYWGPATTAQGSAVYPANPPGLTLQDYADILQADPFVTLNGNTVNICHQLYGPDLDPNEVENIVSTPNLPANKMNPTGNTPTNCGLPTGTTSETMSRFSPYGTVEYPVPGPNGLPSTYAGNFQYESTTTDTSINIDAHTTGTSVQSTLSFGDSWGGFAIDGDVSYQNSNSMTWQNESTNSNSNGSTSSAAYSITGPQLSDNYNGPATFNVYQDSVYGTFAFYSDLEPKITLGTIAITPNAGNPANGYNATNGTIAAFPATAISSQSPTIVPITLTNSSLYPVTMVWPAVTFTDPGFQLVSNDAAHPDGCSNQYLLPYGDTSSSGAQTYYCTLYIEFLPTASDAPNPITLANSPSVQATMIAAGTENASSYQNILVTSQAPVSGTVTGVSQGATLMALGNSISQTNPIPNVYNYPGPTLTNNVLNSRQQTFVLTNYYNSGITLNTQSNPITLSNSADFSVLNTSLYPDTCVSGAVLASSGANQACHFTVQLAPSITSLGNGTYAYYTNIAVSGAIGNSSTTGQLALAGAFGTSNLGMRIISVGAFDDSDPYLTVTITNQTYSPMTLSLNFVPHNNVNSDYITYQNECTAPFGYSQPTLGPLQSCTVIFDYTDYEDGSGQSLVLYVTGSAANITYTGEVDVNQQSSTPPCQNDSCEQIIFGPASGAPSVETVTAGGVAQYVFQIAPNKTNYPGTVSLTATGLPSGATASFSPATIAANGGKQTVTMSIQTAATKASLESSRFGSRTASVLLSLLLLPLAAMRRFRHARRSLLGILSLFLVATAMGGLALIGCAGSSGGGTSSPQTYVITVTATAGGASQSVTVPLTIQ